MLITVQAQVSDQLQSQLLDFPDALVTQQHNTNLQKQLQAEEAHVLSSFGGF